MFSYERHGKQKQTAKHISHFCESIVNFFLVALRLMMHIGNSLLHSFITSTPLDGCLLEAQRRSSHFSAYLSGTIISCFLLLFCCGYDDLSSVRLEHVQYHLSTNWLSVSFAFFDALSHFGTLAGLIPKTQTPIWTTIATYFTYDFRRNRATTKQIKSCLSLFFRTIIAL